MAYTMPAYLRVEDILYVNAAGDPETRLDFAQFVRKPDKILTAPIFADGGGAR